MVVVRHPVVVALSTHKWVRKRRLTTPFEHWFVAHDLFAADAPHLEHLHVVKYEDLLARPRHELDALGTFLGLDGPVPADGLESGRSSSYAARWEALAHDRAPWRRWERASLTKRFSERASPTAMTSRTSMSYGPGRRPEVRSVTLGHQVEGTRSMSLLQPPSRRCPGGASPSP